MKKDVASPTPLAHGVDWKTAGHEILHFGGLHDEYKDWDFVGREIDSSPLVHRDGSPMGNYHLEHGDTFLKDRHLARFQQDIDRNLDGPAITTGTQPPAPTTSQVPESVLLMLKAYGIPMEGVNP